MTTVLTYRFRIKDATTRKQLQRYALACNQVWNYCCQIQRQADDKRRAGLTVTRPTAFELITLCVGSSQELGILSDTISEICHRFISARNGNRVSPKFRVSIGSRRALGWIPFRARSITTSNGSIHYRREHFRFWQSRPIAGRAKTGAFVQDARGRWYVTFNCEVEEMLPVGTGQIGIDLGLKAVATFSDGTVIPALQHYRQYEAELAIAQRARNKHRVRAIHAKIANARRHHLHEWSTKIARENQLIVVGNVSASRLAKTRMAKSVLDASWTMLRNQLRYKASRHGARYVEADERWTSQTCSRCGTVPASSPKGMGALGVRSWECSNCGASHDRDVNAALNILRIGAERRPPAVEIASVAKTLSCNRKCRTAVTAKSRGSDSSALSLTQGSGEE